MARLSILGLYKYKPDIFDAVSFPSPIDKPTAISTILLQNAGLGLIYTDPETMETAISAWSTASQYSWEKLANTLELVYNPIWNKDGTISETETISKTAGGSNETKVSAFNESTYQNRAKDESSATETDGRQYLRTEQGNIGVTSTQQLIKEEREVAEFNIYDQISADFRARFCVMVY